MQTTFPSLGDLGIIYALQKERGDRSFPVVAYRRLILVASEIDDIHHEIEEEDKQFADPVDLRVYVIPDEETHPMNDFGIEQKRDLKMEVTVPHLLEVGLATQDVSTKVVTLLCVSGDRFVFSGIVYNVLEIKRKRHYANTDIPILYQMTASRFREEAEEFDLIRFE